MDRSDRRKPLKESNPGLHKRNLENQRKKRTKVRPTIQDVPPEVYRGINKYSEPIENRIHRRQRKERAIENYEARLKSVLFRGPGRPPGGIGPLNRWIRTDAVEHLEKTTRPQVIEQKYHTQRGMAARDRALYETIHGHAK